VDGFAFTLKQGADDFLNPLKPDALSRIAQYDNRKLQTLCLVNGKEWYTTSGKWILSIFVLRLTPPEKCIEVTCEEDSPKSFSTEEFGGEDRQVELVCKTS